MCEIILVLVDLQYSLFSTHCSVYNVTRVGSSLYSSCSHYDPPPILLPPPRAASCRVTDRRYLLTENSVLRLERLQSLLLFPGDPSVRRASVSRSAVVLPWAGADLPLHALVRRVRGGVAAGASLSLFRLRL